MNTGLYDFADNGTFRSLARVAISLVIFGIATVIFFTPIPFLKVSVFDLVTKSPLWVFFLFGWMLMRPVTAFISHLLLRLQRRGGTDVLRSDLPTLSIIIPAYNEEAIIEETVSSVIDQSYPSAIEVIVVDDGSTDRTWPILQQLSEKHSEVRVFTQENQGAGTAQNYALEKSTNEVVVKLDADTTLAPNALSEIARPLADSDYVAVGGNVEVLNNKSSFWTRLQSLEYLLAMEVGRMFQSRLRHLMCISGAFGAFRRKPLEEAGGWAADPRYGEDFDITIRMHEYGPITFAPNAVALTDVPTNAKGLAKQRFRWRLNGLRTIIKNKHIVLNSDFKGAGLIGLPLKIFLSVLSFARRAMLAGVVVLGIQALWEGSVNLFYTAPIVIAVPALMGIAMVLPVVVYPRPFVYLVVYPFFLFIYRPFHGSVRFAGTLYFLGGMAKKWARSRSGEKLNKHSRESES